jgi:hypothetical protein
MRKIALLLGLIGLVSFGGELKVSCKSGVLRVIKEVKQGIYCVVSKKPIKGTLKIKLQKGVFYSIVCK